VSTKAQKIARLKNKAYRDAFVGSQISVGLPFQIRALREQRGWKQSRLAAEAKMLQPRISAMEGAGSAKFNIETLRRLASAFDVALVVRFVPFGELVDWSERFNPDTFKLPSFKDDPTLEEAQSEVEEQPAGLVRFTEGVQAVTRAADWPRLATPEVDFSVFDSLWRTLSKTTAPNAEQVAALAEAENTMSESSIGIRSNVVSIDSSQLWHDVTTDAIDRIGPTLADLNFPVEEDSGKWLTNKST
jgi:transcriptional regulator with XRE-family HTH domain